MNQINAINPKPQKDCGLLLSDDLIFTSRIIGTARDLGYSFETARSMETFRAMVQEEPPSCVIVDLANPGLKIEELVLWFRQNGGKDIRIMAYGAHVDTARLREARIAGCDPVWPRSKFVEAFPEALPTLFGTSADQ